jgi:Tol biopolymer transport system component
MRTRVAVLALLGCVVGTAHAAPVKYEYIPGKRLAFVGYNVMTPDGRYVAYEASYGTAPANQGSPNTAQVWVYDRKTHKQELVSQSASGIPAKLPVYRPTISDDGRYVAFSTDADNLVAGDTNRVSDVFVRDRVARKTYRVSLDARRRQLDGKYAGVVGAISGDGSTVVFGSDGNVLVDASRMPLPPDPNATDGNNIPHTIALYVTQWRSGRVVLATPDIGSRRARGVFMAARNGSELGERGPVLSRDGRYLAFVWEDPSSPGRFTTDPREVGFGGRTGVFVRDLRAGRTYDAIPDVQPIAPCQFDFANPASPGGCDPAGVQPYAQAVQSTAVDVVIDAKGGRIAAAVTHSVASSKPDSRDVVVTDWSAHKTYDVEKNVTSVAGAWDQPSITPDGRYVGLTAYALSPDTPYYRDFTPSTGASVWVVEVATAAARELAPECATGDTDCLRSTVKGGVVSSAVATGGKVVSVLTDMNWAPDDPDRGAAVVDPAHPFQPDPLELYVLLG